MIKININDSLYPENLRKIEGPPEFLYLEGNTQLLNSKSLAIIGARNCSENGIKIATKFATELSTSGITIVSGLAKGIDTVAHTSSYDKKGRTIAVLAGGFNKIFPEENIELYKQILKNDGLVVTEYSPDEEANSKNFLHRNRIVSGLSLGVLIIEAFSRSGTSNTAKNAKKQGKEVFTVPHEIWDSRGVGTNRLLKQGAKLITDSTEILDILKLTKFRNEYLDLKSQGLFDEFYHKPNYYISKKSKKKLEVSDSLNIQSGGIISFSDPKQSQIYNLIKNSDTFALPNDLVHATGYSINEILSILFMLEVDGAIKKVEGGYICS